MILLDRGGLRGSVFFTKSYKSLFIKGFKLCGGILSPPLTTPLLASRRLRRRSLRLTELRNGDTAIGLRMIDIGIIK